jgi:Putative Flp pilus-assembly TadE/G-like
MSLLWEERIMNTRIASNRPSISGRSRRGGILVLAAAFIVVVLAFTAFAVDIGYITMTRTQLQNAADAASLAACLEMSPGLGYGNGPGVATIGNNARSAALTVAALNPAGNLSSVQLNSAQIEFGRRSWDAGAGGWKDEWGIGPYNLVRLTAARGTVAGASGGAPLPLFFAPILGQSQANIGVLSKAAMIPGTGFEVNGSSSENAPILPITYDVPSWNTLMASGGPDNWSYNAATGAITPGPDGIPEIDMYPYGPQALTPGNRGTVDVGNPNNSTADLAAQILNGATASDLAYFGGSLTVANGPISMNGDTGISAGIKDELEAIKGKARAIPLFTQVNGPGNNAMFTITQFVGIRIMYVKLVGGTKQVIAQPAPVVSGTVTTGGGNNGGTTYVYSPPRLVQ